MRKSLLILTSVIAMLITATGCISSAPSLPEKPKTLSPEGETFKITVEEETKTPPLTHNKDEETSFITTPPVISTEMLREEEKAKESENIATLLPSSITDSTVSVEKRSDFRASIATYDFIDGYIYTVYCSPGHVTDIRLENGESLLGSPVMGDSSRWELSMGESIQEGKSIPHLFVRPTVSDVSTTMIITTNKRTYYLKFISFETIFMFALQFRYPNSSLSSFSSTLPSPQEGMNITDDGIDFDFLIEKRQDKSPSWRPTHAYTDGKRTFIQLPGGFTNTIETPSVYFTKDYRAESDLALVNYSIKGSLYTIDFALSRGQALMLVSGGEKVKVTKL